MATKRGPNDNEMQTFAEDGVEELQPVFEKLSDRLTVIIGAAMALELSLESIDKAMLEVSKEIGIASVAAKEVLDGLIPESYMFGVKEANDAMKELSSKIPLSSIHGTQVKAMLSDAYLDFGTGLQGSKKAAGTLLNKALQEQLREKIYSGNIDGKSIKKISTNVFNKLKDQGFTTFIRKDGVAIPLQSYSEMLTRTHIIRAANEGTIKRGNELGVTIMQMSTHGAIDVCGNYEGQIYDTTGKRFPAPPYMPIHPNCKHKLGLRPDLQIDLDEE